MSTSTPSKQISESCFDFLAMEMVDYVVRSTPADNASEGVFYKLERLGFRVGQRLAERYDHLYSNYSFHLAVNASEVLLVPTR
jgi:hypothetical protein